MRTYRVLWWSIAAPVAAVGIASAIATSSVLTVGIVFVMMAFCLGTLSANLQSLDQDGAVHKPVSISAAARHGCAAGGTVVALFGLATVVEVVVLPVAVVLALTSPAALNRWLPGRVVSAPTGEGDCDDTCPRVEGSAEPSESGVEAMTGPELCMAWRRSFVELQRAESAEAMAGIADLRREILDELERRNPLGFDHWMASGARAPSDPSRYLLAPSKRWPH
ncbi:hypothetical protein ACIBL3_45990 [Kribbella sp. NPDC050124]|uniref:hypothetical protein n=1 Tax=Kribbella sp. NPDC050124 TaxID=3364114 RepID=UPI00379138A8